MTREEFIELQSDQQNSGLTLKAYLKETGTSYSTWSYWRRKYCGAGEPRHELAPISFRPSPSPSPSSFPGDVPSGATLLFPNGLRAHFGSGTEDVLRELLDKILVSHVLPE